MWKKKKQKKKKKFTNSLFAFSPPPSRLVDNRWLMYSFLENHPFASINEMIFCLNSSFTQTHRISFHQWKQLVMKKNPMPDFIIIGSDDQTRRGIRTYISSLMEALLKFNSRVDIREVWKDELKIIELFFQCSLKPIEQSGLLFSFFPSSARWRIRTRTLENAIFNRWNVPEKKRDIRSPSQEMFARNSVHIGK